MSVKTKCPKCMGRSSADGLLCQGTGSCTAQLEQDLVEVPALLQAAAVTYRRAARMGGGGGRRDETPLPFDPRVRPLVREIEYAVGEVLAIVGTPSKGWRAEHTVGQWATYAASQISKLRGCVTPSDFVTYDWLHKVSQRLWDIVDRPPLRTTLGQCSACATFLYADIKDPDPESKRVDFVRDVIECPSCGTTVDVRERREAMLDMADDYALTATEASTALTQLDMPVTPERIRKWAERGRLTPVGSHDGRPTYAVSDIKALLRKHEEWLERLREKRAGGDGQAG